MSHLGFEFHTVFVVKFLFISAAVFFTIAGILVASDRIKPLPADNTGLDFSRASGPTETEKPTQSFTARDGNTLHYREYINETGPLIVVIHGSSAHGGLYTQLAEGLSAVGSVVLPDLRGHGSHVPSGDVAYIGQLEDDLADLIAATKATPDQPVVLVGHSSGGGLILRYASNTEVAQPDAAVLLAPYLGYNAPTTRQNSGGWAQPLTRRIIGLVMLNAARITALNHLPVISFRLPENGKTLKMTEQYSYRMNTSFSPQREFEKDIAALPPFEIVVGDEDEAFYADQYEPLLGAIENQGSVKRFSGLSHLDVTSDESVIAHIATFITQATTTSRSDNSQ